MADVKKYNEWKQDQVMDDLSGDHIESEDFNPKEWEITNVIDVMVDDPQTSEDVRLAGSLVENAITFDTSVPKDVNRGDYLWITAMIKKKGTSTYNDPGRTAVIKVRVVDIYYGLQHLNKIYKK